MERDRKAWGVIMDRNGLEPDQPEFSVPPGPGPAPGRRGPLAMGDLVVFVDSKQRRRLQRLRQGRVFQAPAGGIVRHEAVAGLPEGSTVVTSTGGRLRVLRPTLEEYILAMPRRTQVIYPKDLGQIIIRSNLRPGDRVLEAGVGSGATTLALLQAVGPGGQVISYERRAEFARLARENVERFWATRRRGGGSSCGMSTRGSASAIWTPSCWMCPNPSTVWARRRRPCARAASSSAGCPPPTRSSSWSPPSRPTLPGTWWRPPSSCCGPGT